MSCRSVRHIHIRLELRGGRHEGIPDGGTLSRLTADVDDARLLSEMSGRAYFGR